MSKYSYLGIAVASLLAQGVYATEFTVFNDNIKVEKQIPENKIYVSKRPPINERLFVSDVIEKKSRKLRIY